MVTECSVYLVEEILVVLLVVVCMLNMSVKVLAESVNFILCPGL